MSNIVATPGWVDELEEVGQLQPQIVENILAIHGTRGRKAIEAVAEERVKRYKDFTIVVGKNDEYIVENGKCDCLDTRYNLDPDDSSDRCWHSLAVAIATRIDAVEYHDMWYSDVKEFL